MITPLNLDMNTILSRSLVAFVFVVLALTRLSADSVEVRDLKYSLIKYKSSDAWYEVVIELEAFRDSEDDSRRHRDYLDDVKVDLILGFEVDKEMRALPFEFFRASVELVSLEVGTGNIRFYLPPEVVNRDRLRGEPHSYIIRISRKGEQIHQSVSSSLSKESVLQNFEARVSEFVSVNDGILAPQQDTPFASEYSGTTLRTKVVLSNN